MARCSSPLAVSGPHSAVPVVRPEGLRERTGIGRLLSPDLHDSGAASSFLLGSCDPFRSWRRSRRVTMVV